MFGFQEWTARHPVAFWISLVTLAILLGWAVNGGVFFLTAAVMCGIGWQYQASEEFPQVGATRSRGRVAKSRGRERAAVLPPLLLPPGPHVLLPLGHKIQVTKEEHHLDGMGGLLVEGTVRHVAATLHRMSPASPRSTKERVQVRIDGIPVGELTAYMSEHFLPLIRACDERGIAVTCRASVRGNQLKADVVLDAAKAIDLGDDWINEHVLGAGQV